MAHAETIYHPLELIEQLSSLRDEIDQKLNSLNDSPLYRALHQPQDFNELSLLEQDLISQSYLQLIELLTQINLTGTSGLNSLLTYNHLNRFVGVSESARKAQMSRQRCDYTVKRHAPLMQEKVAQIAAQPLSEAIPSKLSLARAS